MGNIFVLLFAAIILSMLEVISVSAGLISVLAIVSVLLVGRVTLRSSLIIMLVASILIDPFYGNILGTYFISVTVLLITHNSMRQILPYDKLLVRVLILLVSFTLFHFAKMIMVDLGQGSLGGTDVLRIIGYSLPRSFAETIIFLILYNISSNYVGDKGRVVKLRPIN